jgi:hypothetical protein
MRKVKLEVVDVPNSTMDVKSSKGTTKKILPGVQQTLAPVLDNFGRRKTGVTAKEYEEIIAEDNSGTEPLSYSEFYLRLAVKVSDQGKEFDLSIPKHKLIYKFLLTLPEVAKNKKDVNTAVHTYYLVDEEAEAETQLSKIDLKMKAYSYLNEMSSEDIVEFLVLYGRDTRNTSSSLAKAKLGDYIENDPQKFISLYEDNNREVRLKLRQMVLHRVIRKEGPAHFYGEEGDAIFLGGSEELAVEFLKQDKNQELYLNLCGMIENK